MVGTGCPGRVRVLVQVLAWGEGACVPPAQSPGACVQCTSCNATLQGCGVWGNMGVVLLWWCVVCGVAACLWRVVCRVFASGDTGDTLCVVHCPSV